MIVDIQRGGYAPSGSFCAFIEGNEAVIFQPQDRDGVYTFIRETLVRFGYVKLGKRDKGAVLKFLVVANRSFAPADGASGPAVARDGGDPGSARWQPRPTVCAQVQRRGHPFVGGGRQGIRADVGLGDARDPAAPVRGVWRSALRAAGDDFQRAHLQSARRLDLSRQAHGMDQDAGGDGEHRSAPGPATRWASRVMSVSTPFTKAIGTAKRACIRSIWWTRSPSSSSSVRWWVSRSASWSRCSSGLLLSFPFPILGFHADNGSEYINHRVAALLEKLRVGRFTKSRARHSNDNALVEGKNANVIRKWFGHDHIPQRFAPEVNRFAQATRLPSSTSTALACSPSSTGTTRAGFGASTSPSTS